MRCTRLVGAGEHHRRWNREAMVVSLEDDVKKLAETVGDWPDIQFSGDFDKAIRDLFRTHLRFPPSWSQEDCDEYIAENADMAATRLITTLDNVIDTVLDGYERQHGIRPHHDDASEMIEAKRRLSIYELECHIEDLAAELAGWAIHGLGRAVASMTGCSLAGRRSQSRHEQLRHRRRRTR
jgi:hypothetical protein